MTDLAIPTAVEFDAERVIALLGLNPRDPKTQAMVAVCQRYAFDPLLKHVVVIPQGGVYVTRDGLLHAAHRSGVFDGMVLESGPDLVDGEWRAVVSVYRKDMSHPFTFPGRYSATGGNRKYAPEMAIKVAECMALRRAFDVSGMGVLEEREAGETPQYVVVADRNAPEAVVERVAPPELTRPVERLTTTPDDDAWQAAPVASEPTTTVDPPKHPDAASAFRGLQAALKKRAEAEGWSRADVIGWVGLQVGRPIGSTNDLTPKEVDDVRAILRGARREVAA